MRDYSNRNSVWLDTQFEYLTHLPCFWCNKLLTRGRSTVDHVIPSYLDSMVEENRVVCCKQCNNERSKISSLASDLRKPNIIWGRGRITKWFAKRDEVRPLLHYYRQQIQLKLDVHMQMYCLNEINLILRLPKNYFSDKTSQK